MAIFLSDFATGVKTTPTPDCAGEVSVVRLDYVVKAGQTVLAGDIIEMGYLPAYAVPVAAYLVTDDVGAATLDVGLITGTVGDTVSLRTSDSSLFAAAADNSVVQMSQLSSYRLPAAQVDRGIGIKPSANIIGAGQRLTLVLQYAQNV